jgi:glycolate oxidase iron-sulfur subunit
MNRHEEAVRDQLDPLLRQCVECGLCLPHCATYVTTGNEVQSPRGRLSLLREMLGHPENPPAPAFLQAFDLCIGCRACETACPGGVPFSLLEYGQEWALAQGVVSDPGWGSSWLGRAVVSRLDRPAYLTSLRRTSGWARSVLEMTAGPRWRSRLAQGPVSDLTRLLGAVPRDGGSDFALVSLLDKLCGQTSSPLPGQTVPIPAPLHQVVFFRGCASGGLLPEASRRLCELLEGMGCQMTLAEGQECCGALASHTGRAEHASELRTINSSALTPVLEKGGVLVVEAAGCGLELREKYGAKIADAATDAVVLLDRLEWPALGSVPLKVAYHDPCHARHGQGIVAEPRRLLARIPGLTLVEPHEAEVCCGSGGAWGLRHGDLSEEIGRRKARHLAATGADLVLTSNPGCLGQIADGLALEAPDLPVLPLSDLLWYAWQRGVRSGTGTAPS